MQSGSTVPDAAPVPVNLGDVLEQSLGTYAVRIEIKDVAGAPLVERIENDLEAVVAFGPVSLPEHTRNDPFWFAVLELRADVQGIVAINDVETGFLRRLTKFVRTDLVHVIDNGRPLP